MPDAFPIAEGSEIQSTQYHQTTTCGAGKFERVRRLFSNLSSLLHTRCSNRREYVSSDGVRFMLPAPVNKLSRSPHVAQVLGGPVDTECLGYDSTIVLDGLAPVAVPQNEP